MPIREEKGQMYSRIISATALVLGLLTASAHGATAPVASASARPQAGKSQQAMPIRTADGQWEYLVVSFGKAYFASPGSSGSSGSKIRALSELGFIAQEATSIQRNLDKLGHYGWDLVCAVGAIGGDQEYILKRRFDPNRSAQEASLVAEDAQRLRDAEANRIAEAQKATGSSLVDLDVVEQKEQEKNACMILESRIRNALSQLAAASPPIATINTSYSLRPNAELVLVVDGTAALLKDGGTYRSSEARELAGTLISSVVEKASLTREILKADLSKGTVEITPKVQVEYAGEKHTVYTNESERFYCE